MIQFDFALGIEVGGFAFGLFLVMGLKNRVFALTGLKSVRMLSFFRKEIRV